MLIRSITQNHKRPSDMYVLKDGSLTHDIRKVWEQILSESFTYHADGYLTIKTPIRIMNIHSRFVACLATYVPLEEILIDQLPVISRLKLINKEDLPMLLQRQAD